LERIIEKKDSGDIKGVPAKIRRREEQIEKTIVKE
jgi:hypothetical protein